MLLELRVENYAVIDNTVVEFAPGLNLLTGETGAGKSILIDALALLLGERASNEMIRHGAEKAVVSAVFDAQGRSIAEILEKNGIDCGDQDLILRREIAAGGKGRVFINNQPATVAVLKQLAPELAHIHAQSETMLAFGANERLRLLDRFASIETGPVAASYHRWRELQQRISELERDEQDRLRLLDLWQFQKKEIEQASLEPGEDQRLESEKRVLANAEKLYSAALGAHQLLYESDSSSAASLRAAIRHVEELARYDVKFQETLAALESTRITVEDAGVMLRDYAEGIDASPQRLAEIEDRLALMDRLKRKYGQTVDHVIAFGEEVARKLNEIENRDEILHQLRKELTAAAEDYLKLAHTVSKKRQEHARKLEKLVEAEINDLAMKARFKVELSSSGDQSSWSSEGFDNAAYLIATNAGEPLHPVEQIASGGEMSRVMLALKATIEAGKAPTAARGSSENGRPESGMRTLVFDEIDTGIGGRAAEAVGKKLKSLGQSHQVLCITHLPQIASFADQHYVIEKKEKKESGAVRMHTTIRRLSEAERTEEIARMLSGARLTETSLRHAEQMLKAKV
ncbi:MAG: DNA repair protein RecN [Acidobacteria bacterium]|nr:MAG: DNA repair protein RecN [Acidobacteriota bacterium]